ncbi:small T antigen [Deltapolyomavirus canis]|nr:small T antigen [Deltapolyomavirus canis]AWD33790.1 small T antigen [Deltapolyomavirus canis]AWD33797.1 small T antigen [Deltapolyomavirus canis]
MDAVLTKAEKKELMSLLSLNAACYGNLPLMQQKYKKAALKFHPDKGGDEEKMKRLNTLFSKVYQNLSDLRDQPRSSSSQVNPWEKEIITAGDYFGRKFDKKCCKEYFWCVIESLTKTCKCICCLLDQQHLQLKKTKNKPCLVWGECLCFTCYRGWFGLDLNTETLHWWKFCIYRMPMEWLNILGKIKVYDW